MKKSILSALVLFFSIAVHAQLKPNHDFHKNLNVQNRVDSIAVFRVASLAPLKYDKVMGEVIEGMELELSSHGAQIDVYSPGVIENFQFKGEMDEFTILKLENGEKSMIENVKVYRYDDKNSNRKSYFYYFEGQKNLLYRKVSKSKKSDYVIYYLSEKD